MIPVRLREPTRVFILEIGEKKVGKVLAYNNRCFAYLLLPDRDFSYLGQRRTLTQAVRLILEHAGYGKPTSVEITRLTGIVS